MRTGQGGQYKIEIDPDDDHEFVSDHFDLNKIGTYTIAINLLMNPDSPTVVDRLRGSPTALPLPEGPRERYEEIQHTVYPYAYIYDGEVEVVTATFKTDPFTPTAWIAEKFAENLASEVRKEGGRVIEMKAYADTKPLFWTNIRIDVISTPLRETAGGSPRQTGIALWATILIIALALIAVIIVATLAFKAIMAEFKKKPGLEDMKPAWGKEALILDIQDAEEYWERPLTPVETLEGMSEEELRELLDQIAEEEVAPEVSPWGVLALVGGLGVVGIGAALALSAARPRK